MDVLPVSGPKTVVTSSPVKFQGPCSNVLDPTTVDGSCRSTVAVTCVDDVKPVICTMPKPESRYVHDTPTTSAKLAILLPSPSISVPESWVGGIVPVAVFEADAAAAVQR